MSYPTRESQVLAMGRGRGLKHKALKKQSGSKKADFPVQSILNIPKIILRHRILPEVVIEGHHLFSSESW